MILDKILQTTNIPLFKNHLLNWNELLLWLLLLLQWITVRSHLQKCRTRQMLCLPPWNCNHILCCRFCENLVAQHGVEWEMGRGLQLLLFQHLSGSKEQGGGLGTRVHYFLSTLLPRDYGGLCLVSNMEFITWRTNGEMGQGFDQLWFINPVSRMSVVDCWAPGQTVPSCHPPHPQTYRDR